MADDPSPADKHHPQNKDILLIIENKNPKNLSILIKPEVLKNSAEGRAKIENAGWLALTVPAAPPGVSSMDSEFNVPTEELGDFDYYSLTGETNPLTPIGTCYNLERGKCYKITFTNNTFGTDCISQELIGDIPHVKGGLKIIPSRKALPTVRDDISIPPRRPSEVLTPK